MAFNINNNPPHIPPPHSNAPADSNPFAGPSSASQAPVQPVEDNVPIPSMLNDPQFEIFEWHPAYQNCQKYFLDHAQHESMVQAVAALVNIRLPFQWQNNPIMNSNDYNQPGGGPPAYSLPYQRHNPPHAPGRGAMSLPWISLIPYIRRLVVTGFDKEGILHGFFGDQWRKGVGPLQECERRNYLFAAKSVGWAKVKYQYDISPQETIPFMKPLQDVQLAEIEGAEQMWSQWLAMEDWMLGPRSVDMEDHPLRRESAPDSVL
jgi:hypothetical protein